MSPKTEVMSQPTGPQAQAGADEGATPRGKGEETGPGTKTPLQPTRFAHVPEKYEAAHSFLVREREHTVAEATAALSNCRCTEC